MIKWNCTREETEIAAKIAKRAVKMAIEMDIIYKQADALMDIEACHCNGCPLRLQELLDADDFNFAHDVFGIRNNINRETGKLNTATRTFSECFLPRYAINQGE